MEVQLKKQMCVVPKVVDFPCGICGKEYIELASVKTSPFENWSIQCDKFDIWYHLVCQNLTGEEPELQPKSHKKFLHSMKAPRERQRMWKIKYCITKCTIKCKY